MERRKRNSKPKAERKAKTAAAARRVSDVGAKTGPVDRAVRLYRSLFRNHHAVMLLIDPSTGVIVDANPAACRFYGYRMGKLRGMKITEINTLPPDQVFGEMEKAGSERRNHFVFRHLLSSGEIRDVEVYSGPVAIGGKRLLHSIVHDVAERKRAEDALRESEAKFRALADNVAVGIIIHREGVLQYVGREAARLMQYEDPEGLIGRSILEFIHPADRERVARITLRRIAGESAPGQYEARLVKRDGSSVDALIFAMLIDYGGKRSTLTSFVDISDLKNAHEALRQSEAKLRSLFLAAPIGIGIVTSRVLGWTNTEISKMLGYAPEDLIGRSARILYDSDVEFERVGRVKYAEIRRSGMGSIETRWRRKDGQIIDVYLSSAPVDPEDLTAGVVFTAMDITERKRSEEALRKAREELERRVEERTEELRGKNLLLEQEMRVRGTTEEALRRTTEQLSMLLQSLPIAPYTAESAAGFHITYVGGSIQEMTGYAPDDFTGDPSFVLGRMHPDDRKQVLESLPGDLESGRGRREYRFRISDGTYRWLADTWHRVSAHSGESSHIAGVWQDITEEKKLRQQADIRLQQVIQGNKMAALGEVVAGVVHEINNPNSFIAYNVPLLEKIWQLCEPVLADYAASHPEWGPGGARFDEIRQDMAEIIEAFRIGSDRINKVVSNLKDFSRVNEGVPMRDVRVNEVIQKTLMIVGGQVRRTVSRMDLRLYDDLPVIQGHFQKLEQVFANLLINAQQSIRPGTEGRVTVTTRYLERLHSVVVSIEDNGLGMDPAELARLFEPFYTTRRDSGGTGLGLSVSYGLIREHGGLIGVLSRPGLGSRFTVVLPVEKGVKLGLSPTLLCLSDDVNLLEDLRMHFDGVDGRFVDSEAEGKAVLAYLEDHPEVDTVLWDPVKGEDVARQVKARFPLIVLIGIGGRPGPPADYRIAKPFVIRELLGVINRTGRQRL